MIAPSCYSSWFESMDCAAQQYSELLRLLPSRSSRMCARYPDSLVSNSLKCKACRIIGRLQLFASGSTFAPGNRFSLILRALHANSSIGRYSGSQTDSGFERSSMEAIVTSIFLPVLHRSTSTPGIGIRSSPCWATISVGWGKGWRLCLIPPHFFDMGLRFSARRFRTSINTRFIFACAIHQLHGMTTITMPIGTWTVFPQF